jgi:hypothetical protein
MSSLNTNHRQARFGENAVKPLRQRSSFQPNSLEAVDSSEPAGELQAHSPLAEAADRGEPQEDSITPGTLHDFGPPLMGGPVPAATSPCRNEDRDVSPPAVRDRARASVAEDNAGKLAARSGSPERRLSWEYRQAGPSRR